jgi:hypothetical protein
MKIKIIQADTRPVKSFLESRDLKYGPPDQMNMNLIAALNNNMLIQPNDAISIGRTLNLLKAKLMSVQYEFVLGNVHEWQEFGEKAHCWIKIKTLMDQMKDSANKEVELFCFIDSDAWVRDENAFMNFCKEFLESSFHIASPRDIELPGYSLLNSGFIAVKNTPKGFHILDSLFNHPDYRQHEKNSWWEQSELSVYHERNPGEVMVLPLNDFNTPCGRIVRHCWMKHLIEPLVIEEVIACMTRLSLGFTREPGYSLGQHVQIYPSS